ncbi:hypothetical protein GP486_003291, partial [Trichoglossum hirsutum]
KGREATPGTIPESMETPTTPPPAIENAPVHNLTKTEQLPKVPHSERSLWSMMRFWEMGSSKAEEEARKSTRGGSSERSS